MKRLIRVLPLPHYRLFVEFEDRAGTISLGPELTGPMFAPLRDENLFRRASIDKYGAVCWPNGADLAPDALYDEIADQMQKEQGIWVHNGKLEPGVDWEKVLEEVREERIQAVAGAAKRNG